MSRRRESDIVQIHLMGVPGSGQTTFYQALHRIYYTGSEQYAPELESPVPSADSSTPESVPVSSESVLPPPPGGFYHLPVSTITGRRAQIFDMASDFSAIRWLCDFRPFARGFDESGRPLAIFLWFVDPDRIEESVRYISAHSPFVNSSVYPALNFIIVSLDLALGRPFLRTELLAESHLVNRRLKINGVLHCKLNDDSSIASAFEHVDEALVDADHDHDDERYRKGALIIGALGSGKTALMRRKVWGDEPPEKPKPTIGQDAHFLTLSDHPNPDALGVLDPSGSEIDGNMWQVFTRDVQSVICCIDVSSDKSIEHGINYLIRLCGKRVLHRNTGGLFGRRDNGDPVRVCLVFTKSDIAVEGFDANEVARLVMEQINDSERIGRVLGSAVQLDSGAPHLFSAPVGSSRSLPMSVDSLPRIEFEKDYFVTSAQTYEGIDELFQFLHAHLFEPRETPIYRYEETGLRDSRHLVSLPQSAGSLYRIVGAASSGGAASAAASTPSGAASAAGGGLQQPRF